MLKVLASSWALFAGIAMLMAGNSMQGSLLSIRGKLEGFDPELMGYIMASFFVGFLGGSLLTPKLIKRVGYVRVFAALGSMISAALIIFAVFVNPYVWLLMRFVLGFCFSGVYVVAESWLNSTASNETRGQTLSTYLIIQTVGLVAGQSFLSLAPASGYELFVLSSVIVSVSFAPILLSTSPVPVAESTETLSIRQLYAISPLGCVAMFFTGMLFATTYGMAAVYAGEAGFSVERLALFVSLLYAPGLVAQYPIGWLSDRMDRRIMIVACAMFAGLGSLMTLSVGSELSDLFAAAAIGMSMGPLYGLIIAYTNDLLPTEKMAAASGAMVFLNGVGACGAPVLVGYLMGWIGPQGFWQFLVAICMTIAGYALYRMVQRAAPMPEETASYTVMPTTRGAMIAEMAAEIYADESYDDDEEEDDFDAERDLDRDG